MINKNTQQTISNLTGTKSESTIYLKKSELPKDISSFRNDVGYISTSALGVWMKEHSYLTKSEISTLIKNANLVVVDSINKSMDDDAISRLNDDITNIKGEIVAIKDRLTDLDADFIPSSKESKFATKSELNTLSGRVREIAGLIPDDIDTSYFATKDEIPTKVSDLENDAHYLTEHQSLAKYAKKSEIPSLDGYATQTWVEEQGYLKEIGNDYAKKSDLDGFVSKTSLSGTLGDYAKKNSVYNKTQIDNIFLSKEDASGIYTTKEYVDETYLSNLEAAKNYLKIEDYRGLKDATVINTDFREKTLEELSDTLESSYLRNGFYIVHHNDIVIIKDNKIIQMFKDGAPQTVIEWEVEE